MVTLKEQLQVKLQEKQRKLDRKKHLQKLVKNLINSKMLTWRDIAKILGVDPQIVSNIKNNDNYAMSLKKIEVFIELLDYKL